jgi:hypothetical protein
MSDPFGMDGDYLSDKKDVPEEEMQLEECIKTLRISVIPKKVNKAEDSLRALFRKPAISEEALQILVDKIHDVGNLSMEWGDNVEAEVKALLRAAFNK